MSTSKTTIEKQNVVPIDKQGKEQETNVKALAQNGNIDQELKKDQNQIDIISIASMQDQKHESIINDHLRINPLVQIDIKKQTSQIKADQILKIFNSLQSEQIKKPNKSTPKPCQKKKNDIKPSLSSKKIQFAHLSEKTKSNINKLLQHYKYMYKPSPSSEQFQKFRYDGKQKLYKYLWYGVQQLKLLNQLQLRQIQKRITKINSAQCSNHIRKIIMDIDKSFRALNKSNQLKVSRQLKNQWNFVITNIKDQSNRQLRRSILNGSFTPQEMATAKEIQFYTSQKKEQILKKQKLFLAQFEAQEKINNPIVQNLQEIDDRSLEIDKKIMKIDSKDKQKQEIKTVNTYLRFYNESSIKKTSEMISLDHLQKMKKRLQDNLTCKQRDNLIKHLNKSP